MKLVVILACLIIERLVNPGLLILRFSWLSSYIAYLQRYVNSAALWRGMAGVIVITGPLLAITTIIYCSAGELFYGMLRPLLAIIVLIYCIGPGDFRRQLEGFITAKQENDIERSNDYAKAILKEELPVAESERYRALTEKTLWCYNEQIFAVLFWFVVLGPIGALLYRLIERVVELAELPNSRISEVFAMAIMLKDFLDWLPIRILGFSFALVGHFKDTFAYTRRHFFTSQNRQFLIAAGLLAVNANQSEPVSVTIDEHKELLGLFDRALIIWLVLMALITLSAWLY